MRIVGIDPSSRKIAIVEFLPDGTLDSWATAQAPTKMKDRTEVCHLLFQEAVELLRPDSAVFIESPVVGRGGVRSTLVQAEIQGVLRVAAVECGITRVYSVNNQTWKKDVVGNGNASKDDVHDWWVARYSDFGDQDLIDAGCIALYGVGVLSRGRLISGGVAAFD